MGFWIIFFVNIAFIVLADLLGPKPDIEDAKPAGIGDFQFPTATEGRPLPMIWGRVEVAGPNVVWYGDYSQIPIVDSVRTGLLSKKDVITGYEYYIGIQLAFCQGVVDELYSIRIGDKTGVSGNFVHGDNILIDKPNLFGGSDLGGTGGIVGTFKFFSGTNTQAVSSYLAQFQKEPPVTGDTPAYRDCCYIAPAQTSIYVGNSASSLKPWKIEVRRTPNGLALTGGMEQIHNGCANPANVIYEVLTNAEWGYAIPTADIDTANFVTAGTTLFGEANGFSFVLDRQEELPEMLKRLEEQIDAIIYLNPILGKWQIKLVRDDYDPLTIPEINDTNVDEFLPFTRVTWEGTKNTVRLPFFQRNDNYKATYEFAQDQANIRIVGKTTATTLQHPGVKNESQANRIVWREIRTLATPLLMGEAVVDRTLYGVLPGDVLAFTNVDLNLVRLPMRVKSVDYGNLLEGKIKLELCQDVFHAAAGTFGDPPSTGWTLPQDVLSPFPAGEQLAFEAPRAFTYRDTGGSTPLQDRVYAAARKVGAAAAFKMIERHASGTPSGAFTEFGNVYQFMMIGNLDANLPVGSAYPLPTLLINASPDTQAQLEASFPTVTDPVDLGTELITLCMVGNEFFLVSSAQISGADVQLNDVYRGVLDSAQENHLAGDPVYLLFVGGGLSDSSIAAGQNVHVKLLPRSTTDEVLESAATQIAFTMQNRTRRPYPPSELSLNTVRFDPTVALEGGAGTGENIGIDLTFIRRDFRTIDEVAALLTDAATIDPSYPSNNSTVHELDVINDPLGTPTLLFTYSNISGTSKNVRRLDILQATGGALPTDLRFALRSEHTQGGTQRKSRYDLVWDFTVSSNLTGFFEFGALDTNVVSAAFTVVNGANNHDFILSTAFTAGDVQYRINAGAFTTLISAGNTTGSINAALIINGDTIEIRHTSTDTGAQKLITMDDGTLTAFGVLYV